MVQGCRVEYPSWAIGSGSDGYKYCVSHKDEFIAVVGIKYPKPEYPWYFIADFAVKPGLRSKGMVTEILRELLDQHSSDKQWNWKAVVDQKNTRAKNFFEQNGWISSEKPNQHSMFELSWTGK